MKTKVDGVCNNGLAVVVFLVVFLVLMSSSSSSAAARGLLLFPNKPSSAIVDLAGEKSIQYVHHYGTTEASSTDDFSHLMGSEECDDEKDEECENRRMVAEAHLDYIYTQNHKHP